MPREANPAQSRPESGSLWERHDEVYQVESVYAAHRRTAEGELEPVTYVKAIVVEPMPGHIPLESFLKHWEPYDPEAD